VSVRGRVDRQRVEGRAVTKAVRQAGVLISSDSEDDWFGYRLETDPRFLGRVEKAHASLRAGRGVRLEHVAPW
jgi:hypothetical protein